LHKEIVFILIFKMPITKRKTRKMENC